MGWLSRVNPFSRGSKGVSATRSGAGYEGGRLGRRDPDFNPPGLGINALNETNLLRLRRRIRCMVDDNPHFSSAMAKLRNNIVGTGIKWSANTGYHEVDEQLDELVDDHLVGVDCDRRVTLAESQGLFFNEIFSIGETLVYFPMIEMSESNVCAPSIELIDGDLLELSYSAQAPNGNRIRQGVEFDAMGRSVAYHPLIDHPNDGGIGFANLMKRRRIGVLDCELVFRQHRINQIRGLPIPTAAVATARMEQGFSEAYLMLARVAACTGVWIEGGIGEQIVEPTDASSGVIDPNGKKITRLIPGMIGRVAKGCKVVTASTNVIPPTFASTDKIMHQAMASGMGIDYAAMTNDYSGTSFSASRSSSLEHRKGYRPVQRLAWDHHTRPYQRRLVQWLFATGRVSLTREQRRAFAINRGRMLRCDPLYPGYEWVNPAQEAAAARIELEVGLKSKKELAAEKGQDARRIIDNRLSIESYEIRKRKELGLATAQGAAGRSGFDDLPSPPDEDETEKKKDDDKEAASPALAGKIAGGVRA